MSNVQKHDANVFLPGCLGPLRRTVVLEDDYDALAAECQRLREALDGLRKVTTGKIRHAYLGQCPDEVEGFDVRDDECPACRALVIADAALAGSKGGEL